MEDTQIIALYLSRQEAAIGETAKKYRGGYVSGRVECYPAGNSQSAEAFPVPGRPESGL